MKMIFTSFGFNKPRVSERLKGHIETAEKSVIVLPYAGFNVENTFTREKEGLVNFGFEEEKILMCDKDNIDSVQSTDYVYVPGGDTFKLLEYLKTNNMLDKIKKLVCDGAIYIGVSAGAALATEDLNYVEALEDNNFIFPDFKGLGICNSIVIPHSDQRFYSDIEKCISYSPAGRRAIMIKNEGAVITDGIDNVTYLGDE